MKKRISILLLCAMLLAGCAAEKEAENGTDTTSSDNGTVESTAEETETTVYDSLVTEDFGGYTFHMLNGVSNYAYVLLTAEELTGETINDAVYNRNSLVSDRLNVNLEGVYRGLERDLPDRGRADFSRRQRVRHFL